MHNDYIIVTPAEMPTWMKRDLRENRNELKQKMNPDRNMLMPKLFCSLEEYINDLTNKMRTIQTMYIFSITTFQLKM